MNDIPYLSQAEIRSRMAERKANVSYHIDSLRSELTLADVTVGQRPVLDYIRERPLAALGAGVAAGLLVGLVTKLAGRKPAQEVSLYEAFQRAYARDLLDDAAVRVARGDDTDRALSAALRRRAPVVYVEAETPPHIPETGAFDFLIKSAIGFGTKTALDLLTRRFIGEDEFFQGVEETAAPEPAGA